MSGGKFEYVQYRISEAAEEVCSYAKECESEYTPETLAKFSECILALRRASAMLQRVDWLASGDDGEECFHRRWREEVSPY
jgi:hypothetical protein